MAQYWWVILLAVLALAGLAAGVWRTVRGNRREAQLAKFRKSFHVRREWLEARFFQLASSSGKPRGLSWTDCDFDDDVVYARDRQSGELSAYVAVAIRFAAIKGGGMEEVEAVSNVRAATAVFRVDRDHWATDGRAIFNLNPNEAVQFYQDNLEVVGREFANPA